MAIGDDRLARIEAGVAEANARLARIERAQGGTFRAEQEMLAMASRNQEIIDQLKKELERNRDQVASNKALIERLVTAAEDAKDDPEELQAVLDGFRANTDVLAASAANTSGQPIPQQTVPVDQPKTEAQGDQAQQGGTAQPTETTTARGSGNR